MRAKAIKLGSWDKHPAYCLDLNVDEWYMEKKCGGMFYAWWIIYKWYIELFLSVIYTVNEWVVDVGCDSQGKTLSQQNSQVKSIEQCIPVVSFVFQHNLTNLMKVVGCFFSVCVWESNIASEGLYGQTPKDVVLRAKTKWEETMFYRRPR